METANLKKSSAKADKHFTTKPLDLIISSVIFLIFFLCPFFFTGQVAQGLGFEKMILFYFLVLLGIVAWVTKGVIGGELSLKRTPLDLPIITTLIVYIISTILSINSKDSLIGSYGNSSKGFAALIIFILFYYLVVNNINAKKIKMVFWGMVSSAAIVIFYSLLQLFKIYLLPMNFTERTSFNPLGSLSGLTMYLIILLPVLVVATAQIKEIHPNMNKIPAILLKIFVSIVSLGAFTILALLTGFTFWPAAIVGMVIVLMFFLSKIIKISSSNLVIPITAFLLLIIFLVLGNFNIMNLDLPSEVSLSRQTSWNIAKASLKNDPFFGTGPSTFYYSFSKYKSRDFNASPLWNIRFDGASGIINELLATVGSLGVIAISIIALIALSLSFLSLLKITNKELHSVVLALFSGFISALLLSVLFSFNNSIILMIVLISVITISAAITLYPEKFKTLNLSFRASAKYALALAAIFLCVSAGVVILFTMGLKLYLADISASNAIATSNIDTRISELNRAIQLAPYQDTYYLNISNQYMAKANQAAVSGGDPANIQNNLSQAIELGKRAVELSPNRASNNEGLALIYENASFYTRGALEWAESFYNQEISLEPLNPTPYLRIALVNMARANIETDQEEKEYYINEAIEKYNEAISKKNDLAAAYYGKGIAYERLGDLDQAIEQIKQANILTRNNIDYLFELGRLYFNRGVTQPTLAQTASKQIAENEISPDNTGTSTAEEELSIEQDEPTGMITSTNDDLNLAEQILKTIIQANPNHANARYSLTVLYQKIGDTDQARAQAQKLLTVIKDEPTRRILRQQFAGLLSQ